MPPLALGASRPDKQIWDKLQELERREADPETPVTARAILAIKIETLRWVLREDDRL